MHKVVHRAGGRLGAVPVVFSHDRKLVFAAVGSVVKVIAVATGRVFRVLAGHDGPVTGVCLNARNRLQVITASLDGTVRVWDYTDAALLRTSRVGFPISHINVHPTSPHLVFVTTDLGGAEVGVDGLVIDGSGDGASAAGTSSEAGPTGGGVGGDDGGDANAGLLKKKKKKKKKKKGKDRRLTARVLCVNTKTGASKQLFKSYTVSHMAVSVDGAFLATVGRNRLNVCRLGDGAVFKWVAEKDLTRVAFHPTELAVCTGNAIGQIQLWYCLSDEALAESVGSHSALPTITTYHWHAHAVRALAFSVDGQYLYSGGEEAVLVIWQLATGEHETLPRLGAPINALAVDDSLTFCSLACEDNSVRVVRLATLKVERSVEGIRLISGLSAGLVIEPRHGYAVTNAYPWSLQFYDRANDRHVFEVAVVSRNLISRREQRDLRPPYVQHVAFSADGEWMATVDATDADDGSTEASLKFWHYEGPRTGYVLNTQVNTPHSRGVSSLAFHPSEPLAVTTGADRKFRTWTVEQRAIAPTAPGATDADGDGVTVGQEAGASSSAAGAAWEWACRSVGFFRSEATEAAAFSSDGSLLAITCGGVITLWDPTTSALRGTLSHDRSAHIAEVAFVPGTPFLVASTGSALYTWNLLSERVWWSVRLPVHALAVARPGHGTTSQFAILTHLQGKPVVAVFDPSSPTPVSIASVGADVKRIAVMGQADASAGVLLLTQAAEYLTLASGDAIAAAEAAAAAAAGEGGEAAVELRPDGDGSESGEEGDRKGKKGKKRKHRQSIDGSGNEGEGTSRAAMVLGLGSMPGPLAQPVVAGESEAMPANLGAVFSAPTHVLPPLSSLFPTFARVVVARNPEAGADGSGAGDGPPTGGEHRYRLVNERADQDADSDDGWSGYNYAGSDAVPSTPPAESLAGANPSQQHGTGSIAIEASHPPRFAALEAAMERLSAAHPVLDTANGPPAAAFASDDVMALFRSHVATAGDGSGSGGRGKGKRSSASSSSKKRQRKRSVAAEATEGDADQPVPTPKRSKRKSSRKTKAAETAEAEAGEVASAAAPTPSRRSTRKSSRTRRVSERE